MTRAARRSSWFVAYTPTVSAAGHGSAGGPPAGQPP
ncbi:hypothetical protein SCE1572_22000 [Sorangium cellulosum So0157-2]|uniref:Uncharacterized protein n=1 Tax=Sorangium cellulosum So0157-2 TaxID=1254432 RepID=S4XWQ6_SORCE|nr:hypothetical protein SCE1572_22000 [Sorangium cellulosum So0157-2]